MLYWEPEGPLREDLGEKRTAFGAAARFARKLAISAFIAWHLASVFWWNIPEWGYGQDRPAALPAALLNAEDAICAWRRAQLDFPPPEGKGSALSGLLRRYTVATATWQNWWMFAPNPTNGCKYLTVKAVVGYDKDRAPIYDPEPLWTSYPGSLAEDVARFGGRYTHYHKFVENLTGDWPHDLYLGNFARFWYDRWAERHKRPPLQVHVICDEYMFPPPFSGVSVTTVSPHQWVYWWYSP